MSNSFVLGQNKLIALEIKLFLSEDFRPQLKKEQIRHLFFV
jgi:hypothetical protein